LVTRDFEDGLMPTLAGAPDTSLPVLHWPMRLALWTVAGAVLAGWVALAVFHLSDDYRVTHMQGVWVAVVDGARGGRLYPPIFDGEHYAGTRYMPLAILLNALVSSVVDDPLIGGKVLAALLMATLLAVVVLVLRRLSCPWPLAAALAAMVVATETGLQAGTTIGGDLLPVVLQTGALAAALRARGRPQLVIAGILAGLAIASKLTAVWAFLAISTWLATAQQWRRAAWFAAACAGAAAASLGAVQLLTSGRMLQHLLAFSLAGVHGWVALLRGPNQLLFNLLGHAWGAVILLPLAAVGALLLRGWRRLSVFHIALGYALLVIMVVYADLGTGFNQLLDVVVLTALAVGELAGRAESADERQTPPAIILAIAVFVIWAAGLGLVRTVGFDLRAAIAAAALDVPATRSPVLVSRIVQPGDEILAEDPAVYVALHRQPVVMDPFMVMRLDQLHPEWVDPLVTRIAERRFSLVVLVVPLEDRRFDYWWSDFHFGPRVAAALRSAYRSDGTVGRYFLYRPAP
jgi:hypothetical protein